MNYMESDKDIKWDDEGQLVLKGKVIPKTHLVDLLHDALRFRKKVKRAKGWEELSRHLMTRNPPKEIIGNESWFEPLPKIVDDWKTPPSSPKRSVKKRTVVARPARLSKTKGMDRIRSWISVKD